MLSTLTRVASATAERRFRGEPAVTLTAGNLTAMFLPGLGMTGVSLRYRGIEHLALPGGLDALRAGGTLGLPLLAPWANRLATRHYRAGGINVDLTGLRLQTDDRGLPIHGTLVGQPGWHVDRLSTRGDTAHLRASIHADGPAFPFPHRLELGVIAREAQLQVDTTLIPWGRRRVPVAFGWHPYLRLPTAARREWRLTLPARRHAALDAAGIPTGAWTPEPAEAAAIGRRTFDDLYALGRRRRLALEAGDAAIELRCDAHYPFAQVWVPPGRTFAALEPMAAPTNALGAGTAPLVSPGDAFSATFSLFVSSRPPRR